VETEASAGMEALDAPTIHASLSAISMLLQRS
jgi:hypothetical protein